MCDLELDFPAMSQHLGIDFEQYFDRELKSLSDLEDDGLVRRTNRGLRVTDNGRLFIRNIAMRFDAYLADGEQNRFSKTI
jgi:oxygen-independent coproporphyrinogen-3 oxidase